MLIYVKSVNRVSKDSELIAVNPQYIEAITPDDNDQKKSRLFMVSSMFLLLSTGAERELIIDEPLELLVERINRQDIHPNYA